MIWTRLELNNIALLFIDKFIIDSNFSNIFIDSLNKFKDGYYDVIFVVK